MNLNHKMLKSIDYVTKSKDFISQQMSKNFEEVALSNLKIDKLFIQRLQIFQNFCK